MKKYNNDFVSFQNGVSTIVAAINAKAGSNHAATAAPSAIAATVSNLNLGITPSGTIEKSYTTNKTETFDVTSKASCKVTVNVPASAVCSGTKTITSNGTHSVTGYASANVNITPTVSKSSFDYKTSWTTAQTYTISTTGKYIVFGMNRGGNSAYGKIAYIVNGSINNSWDCSNSANTTNINITISGTTVTISYSTSSASGFTGVLSIS